MKKIKQLFSFFWDRSLLIFLIIGGINTVVTTVAAQLMLNPLTRVWGPTGGYWGSTAIVYVVSSIFSFIFNRKYSFKSKAPLKQSIVRFAVVIAVCYLLSFSLSGWIVPAILGAVAPDLSAEWVTRIAMLGAQVIFTGCNYIGQRLWAFKE